MSDEKRHDDDLFVQLQRQYLDRLGDRIHRLEMAITNTDIEVLYQTFHQMKGNGAIYGFPLISELGLILTTHHKNKINDTHFLEYARLALSILIKMRPLLPQIKTADVETWPELTVLRQSLRTPETKGV